MLDIRMKTMQYIISNSFCGVISPYPTVKEVIALQYKVTTYFYQINFSE